VQSLRLFALSLVTAGLSALAGAEEPVTLRYACTDGADSLKFIYQVVDEFERAHPNIKIKVEPVVDNYTQKLLAMTAGRVQPDIARMGIGEHQKLASRGALMPLDDFIRGDSEVKLADYYQNMLEFFRYEGKLYALPRSVAPTGLIFYNKRLLREAGLKEPDGSWTWTYQVRPELKERDFLWCVQQATKRNGKRTTQYGLGIAWPQLWFNTLLISRGLKLWDSNEKPTRLNATDPQVVELMNFASATVNQYKWIPTQLELTTTNTSVQDQFMQGKIAYFQSGPWMVFQFRRDMKDDWDMTLFPAFEGQPKRGYGEGNGTSIFSSTKHPKEAWEFVKWMSGPKGMTVIAKAGKDMPAIRSLAVAKGIWLSDDPEQRPKHLSVTDPAAEAMAKDIVPEYFAPIAEGSQGIAFDILNGVKPPEITLKNYQERATRDLEFAVRRLDRRPYPFGVALTVGIFIFLGAIAWVYWPERRNRLTRTAKKENKSAYWFLLPWILGMGLTLGPMIYSFLLSFADSDIIQTPAWVGLQNYTDAFAVDDSVLISIRQTFLFAALSIPIGMVAALSLALLLNQKVKGVPLFRAMYYLPSLASGVAMSLIWMRIFNPETGLINALIYGPDGNRNLLGLGSVLSHAAGTPDKPIDWLNNTTTVIPAFVIMGLWGAGAGTIIYLAGLQGISQQYYEAATIDGAGIWTRFRKITFPLLTPTIFFSLITGVIGALQVFTQAVIITGGGPDRATLFYMVNLYTKAFTDLRMGYASAMAWILFAIILTLTVIQLKASKRWVFYEGELK
jgi:ABC-type sugar transport system permease subunit/ABC-type glycerol-3-phosphate transport system substrate-binding protein